MERAERCQGCGKLFVRRVDIGDEAVDEPYCADCYRAGAPGVPGEVDTPSRTEAGQRAAAHEVSATRPAAPSPPFARRPVPAAAPESLLANLTASASLGSPAMLASTWWLFGLRGLLAVLFGVMALLQPLAALAALVLLAGVWAFIDGISALALALGGWRSTPLALGGLLGIGVGLFTFWRPDVAAVALYAAFAAWAIARGILELVVAVELRRSVQGEHWLALSGVASLLFGALLVILPGAGLLAIGWLLGVYALMFGGLMLALALRLYRLRPSTDAARARLSSRHFGTPQPT